MQPTVTTEQFEILRQLDACTLANAVEAFHTRLRNEGFINDSIRCQFPHLTPMLGYAATIRIRGSAPPTAENNYNDRTDWWDYILSLPAPRVVVVQDMATQVGLGSLLGAVHINILHALDCVGAITNGSVRDIPAADKLGFHLFAGHVSVSHAYVHIVEFGTPVEIGGLKIHSGDLLHGDLHGVQSIPLEIAAKVPMAAAEIISRERDIITLCQSKDFSVEKLRALIAGKRMTETTKIS
jgi:regulator of RNase E activity RraA